MQAHPTPLEDVLVIEPEVFTDKRGFFMESWNAEVFGRVTGNEVVFVQDNHSSSRKGVLRGLHYQLPPEEQGKLVRTVVGAIFDVAVDVRRSSPTFGQWTGVELTAENRKQLWIPPGFAHGFLALTDSAEVCYKATGFYAPDLDRVIAWDDPDIGIDWTTVGSLSLSDKDAAAPRLRDAELFE